MFSEFIDFVRKTYNRPSGAIPLHAPTFSGNEKKYLINTIDSTFVSTVGEYVPKFEDSVRDYTGAGYAVSTVNGTSALHLALHVAGVQSGDLVLTQSLTFVATCNAIRYIGADPVFVDVNKQTLSMCPQELRSYLDKNTTIKDRVCYSKETGQRVKACLVMHTFGHPAEIEEIAEICRHYELMFLEDAAEALGSRYRDKHLGTFGEMGIFSFNGNKVITTGGGGMIVTSNAELAKRAKHLATTAKLPSAYEFYHDSVGFNYRLPNLNAALGLAQMEQLEGFVSKKRQLAQQYSHFFSQFSELEFYTEPQGAKSNYWLNAVILPNRELRDLFLQETNAAGVMTRPTWVPMHQLKIYESFSRDSLSVTEWLSDRIVNLPSSPVESPPHA